MLTIIMSSPAPLIRTLGQYAQRAMPPLQNPVEGLTQPLIDFLQSIAIPAGIAGIMFALIAIILVPLIPSLAAQKGYIQTALLCVAAIGFIPALVTYVGSLGGGAASLPSELVLGMLIVPNARVSALVQRIARRRVA